MLLRINKQFVLYALCVVLLLITCLYFKTFSVVYAESTPKLTETILTKKLSPSLSKPILQDQPLPWMSLQFRPIIPLKSSIIVVEKAKEPILKETKSVIAKPKSDIDKPKSMLIQYEVTVPSLNIRAGGSATSKILRVTKKGDLLNSLNSTGTGWLALEGGGFVNSKYIKRASESNKPIAKVTILSKKDSGDEPIKPSVTIQSDSGLIEADIKQIFEGTSLADLGLEKEILQIEVDYGINAYFTIAVMKLESGNGNSKIAKDKNNLFGLNAIDGNKSNKAFSFKTKGESVRKFGQIISKSYVNKGYTTIEKVAKKYCNANPKWPGLVKTIMNNDYKKL